MAKTFSVAVEIGGRIAKSLPGAIKGAESAVSAMGRRLASANAGVTDTVNNIGRGVSAAGKRMQDAGRSMTSSVSAPLGLLGLGAGKTAFEFEKAGNMLEALGDATAEQRKELEEYANVLNKKYPQTLTGIINTGNEMLKGGFDFTQMKGALDQTLATAVLGDMAPAEVGNMMARTINSFQLPMKTYDQAMQSSSRVADQMTYAAVKTTASLRDMGEAYRYVGGAASAGGISFEKSTALIMAMAKNGSVGSDAGVALRSAIVRMVKMPGKALAAMDRVGMKLGDYVGSGRKVTAENVIGGLQADGIDATPVKKQIAAALSDKKLVGSPVKLSAAITKIIQQGVSGVGKDAIDAKTLAENVQQSIVAAGSNIDLIKFFTDLKKKVDTGQATLGDVATILEGRHASRYQAILQSDLGKIIQAVNSESGGFAQSRYGIVLKGIVGPVYDLSAAVEKLAVAFGRAAFPTLAEGISSLADGVSKLSETNPRLLKFISMVALGTIALGPFLMAAGATVRAVGLLGRALGLLATAATFGLASRLVAISAAIRGFAAAQIAVAVASIARLRSALVGLMMLGFIGGRGAVFGALALGARTLVPALLALLSPVKLVTRALKLLRFAILGTGVGAILLGIGAAGQFIYNNWKGLGKAFASFKAGFLSALGPEAQSALKPIGKILSEIGKAWDELTGRRSDGTLMRWGFKFGQTIGGWAATLVDLQSKILATYRPLSRLVELVGNGLGAMRDYFADGSGNLLSNTAREWETIKSTVFSFVGVFESVRSKIAEIPAAFESLKSKAQEGYNAVLAIDWASLGDRLSPVRALAPLFDTLSAAWERLKGYFVGGSGDLFANTAREIETVKSTFSSLIGVFEAVRSKIAEIPAAFESLKARAQEGYNAVLAINWAGLGSALVEAIVSGITSAAGRLVESLKGVASRALEGAKAAIGLGGGGAPAAAAAKPSAPAVAGARALGGPVRGGLPYLVGERGPEIFVPGATGRIETNGTLRRLAAIGSTEDANNLIGTGVAKAAPKPVSALADARDSSQAAPSSRPNLAVGKLSAIGSTSGDSPLRAPTPGDIARAGASDGGTVTKRVQGGDVSVVNNWTINGANDPEAVRRQVDARFRTLLTQLESEQRGLLSD